MNNDNGNTPPAAPPPFATRNFHEACWLAYQGYAGRVVSDLEGFCTFFFEDSPELQADVAAPHIAELGRYERTKRIMRSVMDQERERTRNEAIDSGGFEMAARVAVARERERARFHQATPSPFRSLQVAREQAEANDVRARLDAVQRAARQAANPPKAVDGPGAHILLDGRELDETEGA